IVDELGLRVEGRLDAGERIHALRVKISVVEEEAGLRQPDEIERRRDIKLPAPDSPITDIVIRVDKTAAASRHACADEADQVADFAMEEVDADNAALANPVLVAQIDAPRGFKTEIGVTDRLVIVARRFLIRERH